MRYILFFCAFLLFACNRHDDQDHSAAPVITDSVAHFKKFLAKFKVLSLPFKIETGCYQEDPALNVKLDPDADAPYIYGSDFAISIGMLPDTSHYYALIIGAAASCYMPLLNVYSKQGRLMGSDLVASGCGGGCGYLCSDSLVVNSLTDITSTWIQESYECDSLGNETRGTWEKKVSVKKFSVNSQGKIEKKITQSLQNRYE